MQIGRHAMAAVKRAIKAPFLRPFAKASGTARRTIFLEKSTCSIFGKNRRWADRDFRLTVPETLRMVGWFEALDAWGENVALTRSRQLIDGSLSLDSVRSRVDGGGGGLGPLKDSVQ